MTRRIALSLEYCGADYCGWQRQNDNTLPTVQSCVEEALSRVANAPIQVFCAGRTDKGVHATSQIIHFDTTACRPEHAWVLGANSYLPHDIRIHWARAMSPDFHARFKAIERQYRYIVYNYKVPSSHLRQLTTWIGYSLDVDAMCQASKYLCGKHNFSSFQASGCQAKTSHRDLHCLNIKRRGRFIEFDIRADAFLYHMVRNLVGVLIDIGRGKHLPEWAKEVLLACDRRASAMTAPAAGLYLSRVKYARQFGLDDAVQSSLPFFF